MSGSILAIISGSILAIIADNILAKMSNAYRDILAIWLWHTCDSYLEYLRFAFGILAIWSWHTCDSLLAYLRFPLTILAIWSWHSVGILAILALEYLRYCAQAVPLALHTCDFVKHTCEKNRKYGFTRNIASMAKIASTHEKSQVGIASMVAQGF